MSHAPLYNWLTERTAGALLHISSLPSDTGIGNLGVGAYRYIDFLKASGLSVWQICPLGPTGFGDSPYQCFSAFAGNPYFIDLEPLRDEGLVTDDEYAQLAKLPRDHVDYGAVYHAFWPILRNAYQRFKASQKKQFLDYGSISKFCNAQNEWLEDYALFLALKESFDNKPWQEWPSGYRNASIARTQDLSVEVLDAADGHVFYQYLFYAQLAKLRAYAGSQGVEIMGDAPIFVALDSADVWANPELFQLKKNGQPKAVAGVPPDYFAADGQLWGNPLYDWSAHEKTDFAWWIQRIQSNLEFYDIVRLDHFRGFESYWSVPADEKTARNGKWIPCPGLKLFKAIQAACPDAKLVAEDLGVITDKVNALRLATGLPGMAVLQFAFGGEADNAYLPHNYDRNCVVYSGTHDNDTTLGWYRSLDAVTQDHIRRYLKVSGDAIAWDFIRAAIASSAHLAVFPLQDLMSLGAEARLNTPGAPIGNWQWRYQVEQLEQLQRESSHYLREQIELFGR
ncbi:4-alpha-glucanotransferase [Coraliomargarita sp. SDUM461004]|uniref:4-alpha-glucanotransferase n=1 Tax=Thalassobacterium sedimentorum TaxID=3041258 RepID=A0ABU1AGK4_9BACT|nr:4-alpha-glucanotransferase [Coraliomargarita sp. SDUM461004]MDQ8193822.1 4-alpha-glucanotransferase [Coraliomargarita sp. SDUM461004]